MCRGCRGKQLCDVRGVELDTGGKKHRYDGPLCEHITDEARYYLTMFGHYKAGYMEQAGGVLDQNTRYLAAMAIIGRLHADYEREQMKRG